MSSTDNAVEINMVLHFHLYTRILRQRELSFYTDNPSHETVYKMNEWLRKWIGSRFHPMASLYSFHTIGYIKPQDTLHFLQSVTISLIMVSLAANNCMCTL